MTGHRPKNIGKPTGKPPTSGTGVTPPDPLRVQVEHVGASRDAQLDDSNDFSQLLKNACGDIAKPPPDSMLQHPGLDTLELVGCSDNAPLDAMPEAVVIAAQADGVQLQRRYAMVHDADADALDVIFDLCTGDDEAADSWEYPGQVVHAVRAKLQELADTIADAQQLAAQVAVQEGGNVPAQESPPKGGIPDLQAAALQDAIERSMVSPAWAKLEAERDKLRSDLHQAQEWLDRAKQRYEEMEGYLALIVGYLALIVLRDPEGAKLIAAEALGAKVTGDLVLPSTHDTTREVTCPSCTVTLDLTEGELLAHGYTVVCPACDRTIHVKP